MRPIFQLPRVVRSSRIEASAWVGIEGASKPPAPGEAIEVLDADEVLGIGVGSDILIVDDDEGNRVAYEAALAPLNRRLVLVGSGTAALASLLEQDFALMLLDVSMPGMDGVETARHVRARPRNRGMPIIFITGVSSGSDVMLAAYEAGATDFVVKPILPEVLRAKVHVYIRLQERTNELMSHTLRLREAQQQLSDHQAMAATAHRLELLQEATAALAHAKTPADVAGVTVRIGADAVAAAGATLWLARGDGSLVIEGSHGVPEDYLEQWRVVPAGAKVPVAKVFETRRAMWVESEADYEREAPETLPIVRAADRVVSFAALPLGANGHAIGVLSFIYERGHTFTDEERSFLNALVRACEQALDRANLYVLESEARHAAEAASARKDEFLAMLGHELRNPLAAMKGALELMKTREGKPTLELAVVSRQADHLAHIVDDLVDVSRITRGQITLTREAVQLSSVVASAVEAVRHLIDRRHHTVVVNVPENLLIDADRHRVRQVLENLLTNSAKFTPESGRIEVSAELAGKQVRISVRDNGRGIAATLLPNLFDLFVQNERALDRAEGGLGIGLTFVRALVELHGGTIEAQSDGPGTGATFVVCWPRATTKTPTAKIAKLVRPVPVAPLRVLLVDDNIDAAAMLGDLLRASGHDVTVAHDGPTALVLARDIAPQVALLDIGLPNMDGYELARRMRELSECATTVLVAVTGYGEPDAIERSKQAGFEHHLVKPIDSAALAAILAFAVTSG